MEIIAKTKSGVLINATESEVEAMVNAVTGQKPKEIKIGLKVPAIDFASTITKVRALADNYSFRKIIEHTDDFKVYLNELVSVVNHPKEIDV